MVQSSTERVYDLPFTEHEPEIDFESDFARVEIAPVAEGVAPALLVDAAPESVTVRVERDADRVRVRVTRTQGGAWWGPFSRWDTRVLLRVPANVSGRFTTAAGSLEAYGLTNCTLEMRTQAGRIGLDHVHGNLHLETDAGSIQARDVSGAISAATHAGSVRLELASLDPGEHEVRADVGSIQVELPRDADVDVQTRTTLGGIRSHVQPRPGASATLRLTSEVGSIRVREHGHGPGPGPDRGYGRPTPPPPPGPPAPPRPVDETRDEALRRVLALVESGKITARDAEDLLRALG